MTKRGRKEEKRKEEGLTKGRWKMRGEDGQEGDGEDANEAVEGEEKDIKKGGEKERRK